MEFENCNMPNKHPGEMAMDHLDAMADGGSSVCTKEPKTRAPRTPRPREMKLLNAIVEGAPSLSAAMRIAGFKEDSSAIRERLEQGGDLRETLDKALTDAGLTLPTTLQRLSLKLDAKRHQTIAGVATITDDNDAQLRAIENTLKLHERAGRIPAAQEGPGSGAHITVNVMTWGESVATGAKIIEGEKVSDSK